jgi:hypothetical protein
LVKGRGSAAGRRNFTICPNASLPEKLNKNKSTTARTLRVAEYIFFSRPDPQLTNSPQTALAASFLMAVNRKLPEER